MRQPCWVVPAANALLSTRIRARVREVVVDRDEKRQRRARPLHHQVRARLVEVAGVRRHVLQDERVLAVGPQADAVGPQLHAERGLGIHDW